MEKLQNANRFSCCADTTFLASQLNDDRWPFEWLNKGEPKRILSVVADPLLIAVCPANLILQILIHSFAQVM